MWNGFRSTTQGDPNHPTERMIQLLNFVECTAYNLLDELNGHGIYTNPNEPFFDGIEVEYYGFMPAEEPASGTRGIYNQLVTPLRDRIHLGNGGTNGNFTARQFRTVDAGRPAFAISRFRQGTNVLRDIVMRYPSNRASVPLRFKMGVNNAEQFPNTFCVGETDKREPTAAEHLFGMMLAEYTLQEREDIRVMNMAGIELYSHGCMTSDAVTRQARMLEFFDRYRLGPALLQPKIRPEDFVRVVVPTGFSDNDIKTIVRQHEYTDANGVRRRYYYLILLNTLDNEGGTNPTDSERQKNQHYLPIPDVTLYVPSSSVVKNCVEIGLSGGTSGAWSINETAVSLSAVVVPPLGARQQIGTTVSFAAADVKIYRFEMENPTTTPVMPSQRAALANDENPSTQPDLWQRYQPDYSLSIAPNPSTDETSVRFALTTDERVSLAVYDMLGRIVLQPLHSEQKQRGSYELPISTRALATGMYRCVLTVGQHRQTIMLHVLR